MPEAEPGVAWYCVEADVERSSLCVVDALVETEELAFAQLARLDGALDDDKAEAEELGVAERQRRASYPLYRAA